MNDLYEPDAYFGRLEDLYIKARSCSAGARARYWRKHPWQHLKAQAAFAAQAVGLFARLMAGVPEASLRKEYRRRMLRLLRTRRDPGVVMFYVIKCAMHYHAHYMARQMASGGSKVFNSY